MAYVSPEHSQISPFNILLGTISSQLSRENIRKIKVQLRGHINKELLSKLKGGFDVMHILQDRGLVAEKKLSFLRKLLQECELFALIELLDEYKQAVHVMNGKSKEGGNSAITTRRINTLQRLMGRQLEELANCSAMSNDLSKTLEEKQMLLDSQKEIMIIGQEAIDNIEEQREMVRARKERDRRESARKRSHV
ncbi:hypothetical protein OS493_023112 [Desmophyllum pertusum]|uniref:DED domain-containing protein n=1 Tax=Desmophyllum pertusum TaxID=174260 RepID=A0A9X0CSF2_9CNID|nr:hypothetical protein OS493_023112 [Desmophyllum pertusum]